MQLSSNVKTVAKAFWPHSQRSAATLQVCLSRDCTDLPLLALIDACEQVLGTALQTAVKRTDEQAFVLANGHNLMFCLNNRAASIICACPWLTSLR